MGTVPITTALSILPYLPSLSFGFVYDDDAQIVRNPLLGSWRLLPNFFTDVNAALAYLRTGEGTQRATFTVGFCMGGNLSFFSGTQDFGFAGVIGFYSGFSRKFPGARGTLLEEAVHIKYPVLGLFGGADQGIPPEQVQEFDEALDKAGVEHKIIVYPGAPHSFFDRRATDFAEASADAWRQVLSFIAAHTS